MSPITVMFQDEPGNPQRRARLVWDEETRAVFADVIAEACAHAVSNAFTSLGIGKQEHADQHRAMTVLIPWIEAQKRLADRRADFFDTLLKENVRRAISVGLWITVLAVVLGAGKALHLVSPDIVKAVLP